MDLEQFNRRSLITPMSRGVQCFIVVAIGMVLEQQHQGRGSTCCCGAEGIRYCGLAILVVSTRQFASNAVEENLLFLEYLLLHYLLFEVMLCFLIV